MSGGFGFNHERTEDEGMRQFVKAQVDWLQKKCIEIPSPYWPYLVNIECQRLLDRGVDEAIVRRIYRRTVRELRLQDWP